MAKMKEFFSVPMPWINGEDDVLSNVYVVYWGWNEIIEGIFASLWLNFVEITLWTTSFLK